ncbi:ABC transporter permease [Paenibacillus sp. 1011MAR3C5]|uniref:ABC transporter permease n=1 Tax=Paenibacillus sp. 1011MAR3C5 TaxID=1675787 RepID=UPI000E6C7786|nr:ABC transporter permease subunit [Paenibacillus sp. 1011MAR3C5]RJE87748.1 ABC transporter permease [Paenibacillus sp. 1011MAR3C5]
MNSANEAYRSHPASAAPKAARRSSGGSVFLTLLGKECLELLRSFKLIWVPIVFAVLGIMQPVLSYYMPIIIEKAGNMPEGTVIEIPPAVGAQVLADTLSQFGVMGLLILSLAFMGIVSGERNNGASALVLVKPVSYTSYILSKWLSMMLLTWGSLLIGYAAGWYYTWLLIDFVDVVPFLLSFVLYGLWFTFVLTVTLLFSTILRSAAGAAFSSLGAAVLLSMLAGLMPKYMGWSPGALSALAYQAVISQEMLHIQPASWWSIITAMIAIAALLAGSVFLLKRAPARD